MTARLKMFLVTSGTLLLAIVMSACSGDSDPVSTVLDTAGFAEVVHAAPDRAAEAGTARFEMNVEVKASGYAVKVTSAGEMDFVRGAAKQTVKMDGMTLEQVMLDDKLYMRRVGSDDWFVVPVADMQRQSGMNPENLQNADPMSQVDALAGLEDIEFIGEENVRGQATKHYRGYTDIVAQAEELSAGDPQAEEVARLLAATLSDPMVPTDVWIDAEGRAVRTKSTIVYDWEAAAEEIPALGEAAKEIGKMTLTFQVEFYDWGVPVDIQAPI